MITYEFFVPINGDFRKCVADAFYEQANLYREKRPGWYEGPVTMSCEFYFNGKDTGEHMVQGLTLTSLIKSVVQECQGFLFRSAAQVDHFLECTKQWCFSPDKAGVKVTVKLLEP